MAYIGFNPSQLAIAPFATKYFTGDGSTTTFTLDQSVPGANEANVEVFVENVQQNPIDAYTIGGALNNQLIFSEAPVTGAYIYVIHKGEATYNLQPSTGSVTAATLDPVLRNFTVDKFTGTGAQTAFTLSDTPYSPNSILVTVDGIVQQAGTNYTVSGTTLTFAAEAPDLNSDITVVHLGFSSGNKAVLDASITPVKLSTGGPTWDTSSNMVVTGRLGLGGTYGSYKLGVGGNAYIGPVSATRATTRAELNANSVLTLKPHTTDSTNMNIGTIGSGDVMGIQVTNGGASASWHIALSPFSGYVGIGTGTTTPNYPLHIRHNNYQQVTLIRDLDYASVGAMGTMIQFGGRNGSTEVIGAQISGVMNTPTDGWLDINVMNSGSQINVAKFRGTTGGLELPYGQIKFPAAQNASSDANTLDDYEEGAFFPTVNLLGTITYGQQNGRYVKIGRFVTVSIYMMYSSTDSTQDANVMYVQNLPYAVSANGQGSACMLTERMYGVHSPSAVNTFHVQPAVSSSSLILLQNNWNGGITNASYFVSQQRSCYKGGNQYLIFTLTYEAIS